MARVIGIGVIGIDAEDEFRHPLAWVSKRKSGGVHCFHRSVAGPLSNPVFRGIAIVRFGLVYVNLTALDGEELRELVDGFTD